MRRILPILIALPAIVAAGYVHGRWTDRWTPSRAVESAVARLARVPATIGDWEGHDLELTRETAAMAGIDGSVMRRYVNRRTGAAVSILLVCGRPGPIAAHTPEVCYGGVGYEILGEAKPVAIQAGESPTPAAFFSAKFARPRSPDPGVLHLLWAWNGDGTWETSDNPRLSFARHRCLYKLYLVREATKSDFSAGGDPSLDFAKPLLDELQVALF